jgi:hypothetical protein
MIRIPETLSISKIDEELVLLDKNSGKYFGLNPIGSRIFQLLKETGDEERVLAVLRAEYEATEERLRTDLASFVDSLEKQGLVSNDAP